MNQSFKEVKEEVVENLDTIKESLIKCVEEGMIDEDAYFYNEILGLVDQAALAEEMEEIEEIIAKAKTLEIDVAAWHAFHGRASMSLVWPK